MDPIRVLPLAGTSRTNERIFENIVAMSAALPSKKTVSFEASTAPRRGKNLHKKTTKLSQKATPNQVILSTGRDVAIEDSGVQLRDPKAIAEQFPDGELESEILDEKTRIKLALTDPKTGVTPFGRVEFTEEDIKNLVNAAEAEDWINYNDWFARNYDGQSPEQKAWASKTFPGFFKARERQIDRNIALLRAIALLKLHGVTKENMYLQYAMETGKISVDAIENILHPERMKVAREKGAAEKQFQRGLLNPRRFARGDAGVSGSREANVKQAWGNANRVPGAPYNYGVDGRAFSAYGNVSSGQEQAGGMTAEMLAVLKKANAVQ